LINPLEIKDISLIHQKPLEDKIDSRMVVAEVAILFIAPTTPFIASSSLRCLSKELDICCASNDDEDISCKKKIAICQV
jgi:hypothetical protein